MFNGLDIEMGTYTDGVAKNRDFAYDNYYLAKDYLKGLKDGTYPVSTVDEKAARILRLIFRTAMNRNRPWGSFTSEAHYDAARRIGEEGIVVGYHGNGLGLCYAWVGFIRFAIFHMLRYMIAYSIPHFVRLTLFNPTGIFPFQ